MKILLFGGSGQLGCEITKRANDLSFEVNSPVISEINITEKEQISFLAGRLKPEVIINCAAYTAVDQAETDREEAFAINATGAANLAWAAKEIGARFIHISTDYVFDGTGKTPLTESSPTGPLNVYGESKLAGEREVLEITRGRAIVLRTSSLHGACGANFVHTMIKLFQEREEISVVQDQIMSATWAGWLAESVLDLCRIPCEGIVHACCSGAISWYEFAQEIHRLVGPQLKNLKTKQIKPCSTAEFPRPAKRPAYSVMNCDKLSALLGRKPITWRDGLRAHLADLGYNL